MFNGLASLAQGHAKRTVIFAAVFFVIAGALCGGVANKLAPYGADDPSTESVRATDRLQADGYRDPSVIVLDEATSSLDPATEAEVERALAAVVEGRTVIIIAHRLSTAERADRVVVMDNGHVVETASHEELVAQGERYASLWASWQAGLAV